MLGRLVIYMTQDISSTEVHMSFPNTLEIRGCGTGYGLVGVHMGASVTSILIQACFVF